MSGNKIHQLSQWLPLLHTSISKFVLCLSVLIYIEYILYLYSFIAKSQELTTPSQDDISGSPEDWENIAPGVDPVDYQPKGVPIPPPPPPIPNLGMLIAVPFQSLQTDSNVKGVLE